MFDAVSCIIFCLKLHISIHRENNWAITLLVLLMLVATNSLGLINSSGRRWRWDEILSVRGDTMNLGFTPKNNNFIGKLVSERNVKLIVSHLDFYIAAWL